MTEETQESTPPEQDSPRDDSRFEVKWRKKDQQTPLRSEADQPSVESSDSDGTVDLQRELEQERQRTRDLQERWQRAAADLVNLRRRTEQEREDVEKFASMMLMSEILPVLDNFDRALATIPGNLHMLTWIQGVMLVERHLKAILERQGLEPIDTQNQAFSAHLHEAIAERETSEVTPGTIVHEYQKGYTMHGRVIRPALVEVAKAPASGEQSSSSSTKDESIDTPRAEEIIGEAETDNIGP